MATYGAASSWAIGLYGSGCTVMCSLATANLVGGIVGGAAAGFVSGVSMAAMSGASGSQILRAGVQGTFSGAIFGGIGGSALGSTARVGAHAMAGGVMNVLQGGKFGHGFISAGFTKFASVNWISSIPGKDWSSIIGRTMVASVVGGTVSKATGGKFANGANTAAFAHLFNQESKNIKENALKAREHYMKYGVYPRVNGKRQAPSFRDKLVRGYKIMSGVDVSGETHQFLQDNPDLTNGVSTTVSLASIPYRSFAVVDNLFDAGGVAHDFYVGNWREGVIGTFSLVAGEGAGHFARNFSSNEVFERAVGTAVEEFSGRQLEQDCMVCKQ